VPHVAAATDFLLARLPAGNIALRELTGCVAVGQQHPSVTIWQPGSEQAIAYERARFKVRACTSPRHNCNCTLGQLGTMQGVLFTSKHLCTVEAGKFQQDNSMHSGLFVC
jgi:hypothetical protein